MMYQEALKQDLTSLNILAETLFTIDAQSLPFKCPVETCKREFTSKRNLVDHFKGHHQGCKPHICPFSGCGKSFLRPAHLQIHMRIHTGEKPFVCPFEGCGKRWNQKSALKQHVRSHTGEKPFHCIEAGCGKSFSTSSSCKRHILTHPRVQQLPPSAQQRLLDAISNNKKKRKSNLEMDDLYSNIKIHQLSSNSANLGVGEKKLTRSQSYQGVQFTKYINGMLPSFVEKMSIESSPRETMSPENSSTDSDGYSSESSSGSEGDSQECYPPLKKNKKMHLAFLLN